LNKVELCTLEETDNPEASLISFLESPVEMDHGPMVKLRLIRSGNRDILCIKNNHACCDGTGTKDYIQLLSEIYTYISQDFGIYIAKPVERSRREQDMLFQALNISDPEKEWIPGSEITKATWPFPWTKQQSDQARISIVRLPSVIEKLSQYAKSRGGTINDLILAAYYRAMSKTGTPVYTEPMEISVTIDLRRFLPENRTDAIRNFSGSEFSRLQLVPDEKFDETLGRVIPMMREIKNSRPGLQSAIGLERIEKMTFCETLAYYKIVSQWPYSCSDKCAPVLSNLGVISDSVLEFGNLRVEDAYIVPPVVRSPGLLLMVSTYNGTLTLSAGCYENSLPQGYISRLLESIRDELLNRCGI